MEKNFEKQLRELGKSIEGESEDTEAIVAHILEEKQVAESSRETAGRGLAELQRKKQEIVHRLRAEITALDSNSSLDEAPGKEVQWDSPAGSLRTFLKGGLPCSVTVGELVADTTVWSGSYRLDREVPRAIRKRFFVERARAEIALLADRQIAAAEAASWFTEGTGKDTAYAAILDRMEHPQKREPGEVAERMVEGFLRKISIDAESSFTVEHADVYDDVEYKIDLLVRVRSRRRGVEVDTGDDVHDVGVQLTTARNPATLDHKAAQVSRAKREIAHADHRPVEDIVLVALPLSHTAELYERWQKNRKNLPPGGPDMLWDSDTKERVLRGVLGKILPDEELDRLIDRFVDEREAA